MIDKRQNYNAVERGAVYRAIAERRDMRHFHPGPVDPSTLRRLLEAAHCGPSVGLMQPWRFVQINDRDLRQKIAVLVDVEKQRTAQALDERGQEFLRLKVEGILECGELLVCALTDGRAQHVFGRRTLPEMDLASAACAIQNMWLAARVEGLGMGWVSLFDPSALATLLEMPQGSKPIAILCLGHVENFYPGPMLEVQGWARKRPIDEFIFIDKWGNIAPSST